MTTDVFMMVGLLIVACMVAASGIPGIAPIAFTPIAAFIASGMMAVAYFMVHQPGGPLPIINKGELAVVYCFAFLYIAARGSGVWSVDSLMMMWVLKALFSLSRRAARFTPSRELTATSRSAARSASSV